MIMIEQLLGKMHIRSGALLVGAFFSVVGVLMIYHGVKDDGFIDLQSAVVSGQIKSGLVGVTFSFLGALIVIACVISKPTIQKLRIQKDKNIIEWEGVINSARAMLVQMETMARALEENQPESANKAMQPTPEPLRDSGVG
jgi:hypothetical protein